MEDPSTKRSVRHRAKRVSVLRAATTLKSNPFINAHVSGDADANEEESNLNYSETVKDELLRLFVRHLPHEFIRALPPAYQYGIGTLMYFVIISVAISFFVTSYTSNRSQTFLSPEFKTGECTSVKKAADGLFYATTDGYWEHTANFAYSKALYKVNFSNFTSIAPETDNLQLFNRLFGYVDSSFGWAQTNILVKQNLAANLMWLSGWFATADIAQEGGTVSLQTLELTGDPTTIFNLPYVSAGLADGEGLCSVQPTVDFQEAEHHWLISWNAQAYRKDKNCMRTLNPDLLAQINSSSSISIRIDSYSLMALALTDSPSLKECQQSFGDDFYQGTFYSTLKLLSAPRNIAGVGTVGKYFDSRWPGMEPLLCLKREIDVPIQCRDGKRDPANNRFKGMTKRNVTRCLLPLGGDYYGYPYFDHFGANKDMYDVSMKREKDPKYAAFFEKPVYCDCNSPELHTVAGKSSYRPIHDFNSTNCNEFDFLHGLILFKFESSPSRGRDLLKLLFYDENNMNASTISRRAYNAAWYTVPHLRQDHDANSTTLGATENMKFYYTHAKRSAEDRMADFSFCRSAYGSCSMLMLRSTSRNNFVNEYYSINQNYFQVKQGSCNGDFLRSPNFMQLAQVPPMPLQESYFICHNSKYDAFVTAVGNAFGNTAIATPIVIIIFIHVFFALQWVLQLYIPRTYTTDEKSEVLDGVALRILMLRDGRRIGSVKSNDDLKTLNALLRELQDTHEDTDLYFLRAHEKERLVALEKKRLERETRREHADDLWTTTLSSLQLLKAAAANRNSRKAGSTSSGEGLAAGGAASSSSSVGTVSHRSASIIPFSNLDHGELRRDSRLAPVDNPLFEQRQQHAIEMTGKQRTNHAQELAQAQAHAKTQTQEQGRKGGRTELDDAEDGHVNRFAKLTRSHLTEIIASTSVPSASASAPGSAYAPGSASASLDEQATSQQRNLARSSIVPFHGTLAGGGGAESGLGESSAGGAAGGAGAGSPADTGSEGGRDSSNARHPPHDSIPRPS